MIARLLRRAAAFQRTWLWSRVLRRARRHATGMTGRCGLQISEELRQQVEEFIAGCG